MGVLIGLNWRRMWPSCGIVSTVIKFYRIQTPLLASQKWLFFVRFVNKHWKLFDSNVLVLFLDEERKVKQEIDVTFSLGNPLKCGHICRLYEARLTILQVVNIPATMVWCINGH